MCCYIAKSVERVYIVIAISNQWHVFSYATRYLKRTTFIGLNWYRLSFTDSFILIGLTVAYGKVVTEIVLGKPVTFQRLYRLLYLLYGYHWNHFFMLFFKIVVVVVINKF